LTSERNLSAVPLSPEQNCEDLIAAQTVIIFTEKPNTILATGGHHVEFGLALAQNKGVIVVGLRENVFHYLLPDSQMFATWNDAFARIKRCALLQTRSVRHIRDGRAGTQLRAYVAHRRADVDQQPPRWSIGLLTRRFSVILERLGPVGVIQISTLVHYQRGGGGPRAGGGQGSGRARANARISSGGGQSGGGPASYTRTRGYDLPAVVRLLEVHRGVAHYLLLGIWKRDRPPSQSECEIRFQELNFDAFGVDEPPPITVRIPVNVRIMELLPAVILFRIDDNQQIG
jgi:hypothetical protein